MRCSHFLQPSTTCCGSPPGRRLSTAGRGRASPAGCSPPCRRDWRLRSRRMGDEQRVSWQELLARARVFGEQIPRRHESVVAGGIPMPVGWGTGFSNRNDQNNAKNSTKSLVQKGWASLGDSSVEEASRVKKAQQFSHASAVLTDGVPTKVWEWSYRCRTGCRLCWWPRSGNDKWCSQLNR